MRTVPAAMTTAWKAEDKTGDQRPVVRATVQRTYLRRVPYDTADMQGGDLGNQRHRRGVFTTIVLGDPDGVTEIPNIRSCSWNRGVGQDVAECTIVLRNTRLQPIGQNDLSDAAGDFDVPGFLTYNRGAQFDDGGIFGSSPDPNRWGYTIDYGWVGKLVPDRLVKTFEGYGMDPSVPPMLDTNLMQSGTWLIVSADYTHDGDITLHLQDVGCLLIKQIVFPPVIPYGEYPLSWTHIHDMQVDGRDATGGAWTDLRGKGKASSSNDKYIGKGLTNAPDDQYVDGSGGVHGHYDWHALRNDDKLRWVSTGQDSYTDKVWWEVDLNDPIALAAVRIHTFGGPFVVYLSLHNGDHWIGRKKIPYTVGVGGIDVGADIPFVMRLKPERGLPEDFTLPRKYGNITKIRLTFTHLRDWDGHEHPFHAALRDLNVYTAADVASLKFKKGTVTKAVGNYRDYTDVVKWVCAWGGLYWPDHSTDLDFIMPKPGGNPADRIYVTAPSPDPVLPTGNVWGDFMNTGTYGVAPLTTDLFDKKPLMDIISYLRDMLGFIFFIDETGGAVWRLPNLGLAGNPKLGNYLSPSQTAARTRSRTADIVTIDENETLLNYSTTLSSENVRERIFVANTTGKVGTCIRGFSPVHQGFRRVAGWTDQNFATKAETRVMADMIATQEMFDYRRSNVTIPGYPAIQIDDQVRIYERVTNETYYHYVESISSSLDMEQGTWTYEMQTHWLGHDPASSWVVKGTQLDGVTQSYLNAVDA